MATAAVMLQAPTPKPTFEPIIARSDDLKRTPDNVVFDPKQHLTFEPPEHIHMMTDIGYSENLGISPVASSQPFRLFSNEAIQKFRDEIFQPEVMEKCGYSGSLGACYLRGYAAKYAPFIYDAWRNPETLSVVSKIAGVELVPNMNFEIGHINISVKSEEQAAEERETVAREASGSEPWGESSPVVGWHKDSYPFVCVTMLSDCTNMVGGETALRTANGDVMKVRGPAMGCAVVLQGRYLTHQALRALGAQERITMVTSFRAKSPHLTDDSVLSTTRGVSNLSELYYEFGQYRLEILEERIRAQLQKLRGNYAAGRKTDTRGLKLFLKESEDFLNHTDSEMVQDEDVVPGHQPTLNIPNAQTPPDSLVKGIKPAVRIRAKM